MPGRADIRSICPIGALAIASATLGACATARLHSAEELSAVSRQCGFAAGELVQEEEEPRILFLYRIGPSAAERSCAARWARKRHLHLAVIDAVTPQSE